MSEAEDHGDPKSAAGPGVVPRLWIQRVTIGYFVVFAIANMGFTAAIILFAIRYYSLAVAVFAGSIICYALNFYAGFRVFRTRRFAQGVQTSTTGDHPPGTVLCPWCLYPVVPDSVVRDASNPTIDTQDQVRRCPECGQTFWTNWAKWIWKDGEIDGFRKPPPQGPRE